MKISELEKSQLENQIRSIFHDKFGKLPTVSAEENENNISITISYENEDGFSVIPIMNNNIIKLIAREVANKHQEIAVMYSKNGITIR